MTKGKRLEEYRPKKEKPKYIPVHPRMIPHIQAFHKIWYPNGHPGCEYCEAKK